MTRLGPSLVSVHGSTASDKPDHAGATSPFGSPTPSSPMAAAMSQQLDELSSSHCASFAADRSDNNRSHSHSPSYGLSQSNDRRLSLGQLSHGNGNSTGKSHDSFAGLIGLPHPHLSTSTNAVAATRHHHHHQHQKPPTSATSTTAAAYAAMVEDIDKQLGAGDVPAVYSHPHVAQPRDVNMVFGRDVIQVPLKIEHSDNEYVNLALSHREFDVMAVHIPKYDSMRPTELLDEITRLLREEIEKPKNKRHSLGLSNQLVDFPDPTATFQSRILELEYELSRFKTKLAAARALQTTLTDENTVLRSHLREMELRCVDNETLKMQNGMLRDQSAVLSTQNGKLKKLLNVTHHEMRTLASQVKTLRAQVQNEQREIAAQMDDSLNALVANVRDRENVLQQSYLDEKKERQLIAEKYYEISGRIRVFCRVRPVTRSLHKPASTALVRPKPNSILVDRSGKEFSFDQVFGAENSQADVYAQMEPVVVSFADGYNACIMAYGQTGSGKTHTMVGGSGDSQGMIPRALQQVFAAVHARQLMYRDSLRVSMVEIYNDQILDLLTTGSGESGAKIKNESEITLRSVTLWEHVNAVLAEGNSNRNIASTSMNMESSRSHALVFLHLESQHRESLEIRKSTLCLVDLAGSERISRSQVEGERLKETQHINKSLSALGDVMHALQHKAKHVPYRNSKLTYMLRDMLSGQAKTLMMLQLSPEEADLEETICSLQFGARVSQIQMGAVKTSVESGEIFKLRDEKRALEKKLLQLEDQAMAWKQESRTKHDELKDVKDQNLQLQLELGQQHDDLASLQEKFEAVAAASTSSASVTDSPLLLPQNGGSVPLSPTLSARSAQSSRSVSSTASAPAAILSTASYASPSTSGLVMNGSKRLTPRTPGAAAATTPRKTAAASRVSSSLTRPSMRSVPKETTTIATGTAATTAAERVARRKSLTTLQSPSTATVLSARERLARATPKEPLTPASRRVTLGAIGSSASQPNLKVAASPTAANRIPRTGAPATPTATGSRTPTAVRRTNSLATTARSPAALSPSAVRAPSALEKRRALASSRSLPSTPVGGNGSRPVTTTTTTTPGARARTMAAKSVASAAANE